MRGTWQTTDSGGKGWLVVIAAAVAFALIGATAKAVAAVPWWAWALLGLAVVAVAAALVAAVVRAWRRETARVQVQLQAHAQRPVVSPPRPAALPPVQIIVTDPETLAGIMGYPHVPGARAGTALERPARHGKEDNDGQQR